MPTGWNVDKLKEPINKADPTMCNYTFGKKENIIIHGYPYSEHSSFSEVKAFLDRLNFDEVEFVVEPKNEVALREKLGCN